MDTILVWLDMHERKVSHCRTRKRYEVYIEVRTAVCQEKLVPVIRRYSTTKYFEVMSKSQYFLLLPKVYNGIKQNILYFTIYVS